MAILRPFRALRPAPERALQVAAPPYDVINTAEARALAEGNEDSFLYISRPEIALPEGTDEHSEAVYEQGAKALQEFLSRGVLKQDEEAHFYIYAQEMGEHRQVGVVACASVAEYLDDTIKKHEKTRADKEDDRTHHIDTLSAHDEPVFLTYRAVDAIDRLVNAITRGQPTYDFRTADKVRHTLWIANGAEGVELEALFRGVPSLYVADGHHRSAAAARVHQKRKGSAGEHDVFLAVVFPHNQMQILPYNRLVRDEQKRTPQQLYDLLSGVFALEPSAQPSPSEPQTFGVFMGGRWYRARVREGSFDETDPVASLDCSIIQDQLLAGLFSIEDPRRDNRVDFVGGIRGAAELERRVREGSWSMALYLYPTRIDQLIKVSDAGKLMPPKSTWFEPKLRSGLFVHAF